MSDASTNEALGVVAGLFHRAAVLILDVRQFCQENENLVCVGAEHVLEYLEERAHELDLDLADMEAANNDVRAQRGRPE